MRGDLLKHSKSLHPGNLVFHVRNPEREGLVQSTFIHRTNKLYATVLWFQGKPTTVEIDQIRSVALKGQ